VAEADFTKMARLSTCDVLTADVLGEPRGERLLSTVSIPAAIRQ